MELNWIFQEMCFMSGYFAWNLQSEPLSSNSLVRSPDAFTAYENNVKEKSPTWRSIKIPWSYKVCCCSEYLELWTWQERTCAIDRRGVIDMWSFLSVQISSGHRCGHGESVMGHALLCFSSWTAFTKSNNIYSKSISPSMANLEKKKKKKVRDCSSLPPSSLNLQCSGAPFAGWWKISFISTAWCCCWKWCATETMLPVLAVVQSTSAQQCWKNKEWR